MKTIASFQVDHNILEPGIYISRRDGDVITYDLRMKKPNSGDYLDTGTLHTIEHLLATYVRNSVFADRVVYAGPMGCRTGFYLLLRDSVSKKEAINLVRSAFDYISGFNGDIPGASKRECGNYLNQDPVGARREALAYGWIIESWTPEQMNYKS
ncbi:S-ribosylhomocysteine lyase [uncultured Ruminobacter sp.]|jgi:S-ribosylhomocysteine lyase|uniref:S-ribosylhomocysteine lyase n=1 Tax=Ruminobacter sp. TaxID=2774296 RepID=UPI0025E5B8E4|nr:S-ribosylhomocysteine lyase [uncultured Ruminobacter sp.]